MYHFQCINIVKTNTRYTHRAYLPVTIWVYLCTVMMNTSTSKEARDQLFDEKALTILPKLPAHFGNQPSISGCLHNKTSIDILTEEKQPGILICFHEQEKSTTEHNFRPACVYIPAPKFDKLFILKIVSRENSVENLKLNLFQSISGQLLVLDKNFENEMNEKFSVCVLFLCVVNKMSNDEVATYNEVAGILKEKIASFASENLSNLTLEFENVIKRRKSPGIGFGPQRQKFRDIVCNQTLSSNDFQEKNIEDFIRKFDYQIPIEISSKEFKNPGAGEISLSDFYSVVYLYKIFFPGKDTNLETLPHFLNIRDNLLDKTDSSGNLLENFDGFFGEMNNFWVNFVSNVPKPVGLLIKSFNEKNINSILSQSIFNSKFEVDWLYCGHEMILMFEVGRTKNPTSPISTVFNKLEQVLNKLMPTMGMVLTILYNQLRSLSATNKNETFSQFAERIFKYVIFFPNMPSDIFVQLFADLNKQPIATADMKQLRRLIRNCGQEKLRNLLFLLHNDPHVPGAGVKTYYLNSEFEIIESEVQVSEIMQFKAEQTNDQNLITDYMSALLAFSCLIEKNLLSSPNYQSSNTSSNETRNSCNLTFFEQASKYGPNNARLKFLDVILSPQQQRILTENRRRVLIAGEPGSGKSALLLARAKKAAQDDNIHHVIFSTPAGKIEFKGFLSCFIKQPGNELLKQKFRFISFEDLASTDYFGKNW